MFKDIAGQTFGKLTAVRRVGAAYKTAIWECVCKCGNTTNIKYKYLRNGETVHAVA